MLFKKISTSESVTEGHPDKLCDAVSDGVLDAILAKDRMARVACESVATTGMVFVTGEISTNANVDIQSVVRNTVKNIGYTDSAMGFDYKTCAVVTSIKGQSADIAMGVDSSLEYKSGNKTDYDLIGAGDQGTVFGYACSDTPEYMPMTLSLAHKLTKRLAKVRKDGTLPFLWPDGKAQVTIAYDDEMKPIFCPAVVLSTQHTPDVSIDTLREAVREEIIDKIIPSELITAETKYYINPTGRFVTGGPDGDSGLTGRKLICDTYGGLGHHGGGAFSGKDPTKVDRSASYMARYVAKNLVASGICTKAEVEIAYAIGVAHPVGVNVDTFGTGVVSEDRISRIVREVFDMRPAAIIEKLDLRRPIYSGTTNYGHFGREDMGFTWEKTDAVELIKAKF